jgi:hypothetical protein
MAGLPQDRPIPGAPLLDPLGVQGVPGVVVPAPGLPPPYAAELAGLGPAPAEPLPWPPPDWFAQADGQVPSEFQNKDVPTLEPAPPPQEVDAVSGAAPVVDSPTPAAPEAPVNPYPEAPKRPSTGDAYLDTVNDASDLRAQAAVQQAEAEQAKNAYLADEGVRIAQEQSQRQSAADAEYQQVYSEARAQRKALDQEAQDIANQKTDPMRVWKNMSFGKQLFVAVTAALSGFSKPNTANPVLESIGAMVERDVAAQEADLANRWKGNTMRRGLLADEMAAGRDMLDVRYKSLNAAYSMAENQMKAYALKYDNPVISARAAAQLADIEERRMTLGMQYTQAKEQQLYERRMQQAQLGVQQYNAKTSRMGMLDEIENRNTPKPPTMREQVMLSKEQREIEQDEASRKVHLAKYKDPQKGPVRGPTSQVTAEVNDKMGTVTNFVQGLRRIKEIRKKNGYSPMGAWGNDDIKEANAIYEGLLTDFSKAKEQGVIRDGEYKRYERMFGSVTGILDPSANLDAMINTTTQNMNNELQARIGPDVARWEPENTPDQSPYFQAGGEAKKQPAPAGLPVGPEASKKMSPAEQRFIETGRYTPDPISPDELLDYEDQ